MRRGITKFFLSFYIRSQVVSVVAARFILSVCLISFSSIVLQMREAQAQTITITEQSLTVCKNLSVLKTLENMIAVGETHISSIYLKKMSLNGTCAELRKGEKILILRSTPDTNYIILKRIRNNNNYYASSRSLGLKS